MKLSRILLFSLLLCFVFPVWSFADQLEDAKAAIKNEDFGKAFELLSPLAEESNAEAQTLLGALYLNGQGVEMDATKGLSWIMKAADQGFEPARVHAYNLCVDLAKQGNATAIHNVGYMCLNGWGGEQDANECIQWLETAAKLGHIRSANVLSQIYTKGSFGITPDEEKASYWSHLATAFAAGIDGKWTATIPGGPFGPMNHTYDFKADGDTLTGTVHFGGPGGQNPIKDGKIEGTSISFVVETESKRMTMTYKYTGVFLGDELKLSYTVKMGQFPESPPQTFIAKRSE
jgi:hypothetical protein